MNTKRIARLGVVGLLIVALGSSSLVQAVSPQAAILPADGSTAVVNTGLLNVRAGPGVGYTVVTQIAQGVQVSLLGRNAAATWVNIRLPEGIEGWVNVAYLRTDAMIASLPLAGVAALDTSAAVTVPRLELRPGPGTNFGVTATLVQGQRLDPEPAGHVPVDPAAGHNRRLVPVPPVRPGRLSPHWCGPLVGYSDLYALAALPAGIGANTQYAWEVVVSSPDGGSGASRGARLITFSNTRFAAASEGLKVADWPFAEPLPARPPDSFEGK